MKAAVNESPAPTVSATSISGVGMRERSPSAPCISLWSAPAGVDDVPQRECPDEFRDRLRTGLSGAEQRRHERQFVFVEFQHVGLPERGGDDFPAVPVLADVDVEYFQALRTGGFEDGGDRPARRFRPLGKRTPADGVGRAASSRVPASASSASQATPSTMSYSGMPFPESVTLTVRSAGRCAARNRDRVPSRPVGRKPPVRGRRLPTALTG